MRAATAAPRTERNGAGAVYPAVPGGARGDNTGRKPPPAQTKNRTHDENQT
ncbi:protein of unknown function [Cupriavidus taiwanensis]|uniref:Uncharacterized protein n=1 Tax=Cupriavidus taiwanensis TaxID=164546 RepID=A0A9Q7XPB1_9BURK|nr:protein of unknown function [Cupriavidus taiwanensis]